MDQSGDNRHQPDNGQKKKRHLPIILLYAAVIAVVLFITTVVIPKFNEPDYVEIKYSEFLTMLEEGKVSEIEVSGSVIEIKPTDFEEKNVLYRTEFAVLVDATMVNSWLEYGIGLGFTVNSGYSWFDIIFVIILPTALSCVLVFYLLRMSKRMGGGMFSMGKNTSKIYVEKSTGKTFADVAGQDEAKESLVEIIDFINNPDKYTAIGAKMPKGALLVGPPGTGKTLLAKAVAGEAKVPFFSLSGSEFVEMIVGVGASRVRDLFKQAMSYAPCIVFIDEIDAIGKSRNNSFGGHDEQEQTLNQLLSEMDGFDSSKGVVILAATNRPEILDAALLRPGRFDRRIIVDLPEQKGRADILRVHARGVIMEPDVDLDVIARATPGASGADLENIINEAALRAVRAKKNSVGQQELEEAVDVVIAGEIKKSTVLNEKEKKIVAYHEVGHALVTALLSNTKPIHKITIIPRTSGALGYVQPIEKEENNFLQSKEEVEEMIMVLTAGRAAELLQFNSISTGAANDIEKATEAARKMITVFGMSDRFGFVNWAKTRNAYLPGVTETNCSEETSAEIDKEIQAIIEKCYNKSLELLRDNKEKLDALAKVLYEKENLTGEEFMLLLNKEEAKEESHEENIDSNP